MKYGSCHTRISAHRCRVYTKLGAIKSYVPKYQTLCKNRASISAFSTREPRKRMWENRFQTVIEVASSKSNNVSLITLRVPPHFRLAPYDKIPSHQQEPNTVPPILHLLKASLSMSTKFHTFPTALPCTVMFSYMHTRGVFVQRR